MAIELRQQLKLTQQLVMTPQLQQAIKLLQLSRLELLDAIHQEMEENPALEEVQEPPLEETGADASLETVIEVSPEKEVTVEETLINDFDWTSYIDEYNAPGKLSYESEEKDAPQYEAFIAERKNLSDHLMWQLRMSPLSDTQKQIGALIIGNLNQNGYVAIPVDEIAAAANSAQESVEEVLAYLQTFDPHGVCARDLSECLLIQAGLLGIDNPFVIDSIMHHLNHLENRNIKAVCRALRTDTESVLTAIEIIRGFDPRPGRRFSDETPQYIQPDIYVYKMEDKFVIILNDDGMPKLRLSSYYQNAVSGNGSMTSSAKDYMQEKLRSASWLIKSIQQRQKTIYRVMESILKFQDEFFDKGVSALKPMVLRDVAEDIEMHESTISRVTTNKYAYTPQGIFELKYFFNSSVKQTHGDDVASASVQQQIKELIENEDSKTPLSDEKIAVLLKSSGIRIARRTVAKYREIMRILPSNKRKQY